jgi:mannose-1-phosphate guanylyltransferase
MTRAVLLLAGGAGTRLWPLSSDSHPKQFLPLFDGVSLLRKTFDRIRDCDVFVSTNERYREQVRQELPELDPDRILTEPTRRNTAPAITLCCFEIAARLGEETAIACLPADHFIENEEAFGRVLDRAFSFAEREDVLVTIAITPTEANPGYGYLELGEELTTDVLALRRFVEKPDRDRAAAFLRAGNYAWNAGMFVWRASVFRAELARVTPELCAITPANYGEAPSVSIDYALMEKAGRVVAVRGDFGWSDVGSWAAVALLAGQGNASLLTVDGSGLFAHVSRPGLRVLAVGVSNVAIVESEEGILVLDLAKAEDLAAIVKRME